MPERYELNLRDYWNIFIKRKWIITLTFVVVLAVAIIHTNLQPILYSAAATVKIETIGGISSDVFREPQYYRPAIYELEDYKRQIVSYPIVEQAVRESGLIAKDAPEEQLKELVQIAAGSISAEIIKDTNMITVQMRSEDPQQAATLVNKVVEVFKLENIKQKNSQATNTRVFIEEQLEKVSDKLKESEEKLKELTLKDVGRLATSLTDKIIELESTRTDLLTKFTELHPGVMKVDEQIAFLKEQLKNLPKEEFEYSNLKRDVAINERLYNLLKERLQEVGIKEAEKIDNVILVSPAGPPQFPFSPNKPINYFVGIILGIVLGVSAGLAFEHLDTSIGRIEDLEEVTKISVIGVIPYFSEKGKDIRRRFMLGKAGKKDERFDKLRSQVIIRHKESSVFLEAFRILGANLQVIFGQGGRIKGKCILITSSNPFEGKSIISANLSIILSQMGYKTVLVDIDLRRASQHRIFGLEKKEKGVTDVLTGEIDLDSAPRTVTDLMLGDIKQEDFLERPWLDNFHLITAGTTFPNSPYLLNTEKMDIFLKLLRERYDVVILDTSPVLAVSDTSILVPKADGIVLVYRAGATSRMALRRAKVQIESAKGKELLKGIVLNNVTPEVSADAYYYYSRGKYYQEKEEEGKT